MATAWRGLWLVWTLVWLVSCTSPEAVQVSLAPQTPALERLYQDGRVAFKTRRYDDAAAHFARIVAADPEHLRARLNWAAALSHSGKMPEAIVQCQNVLTRDPTNAEAYYQWGAVLARLEQHQEAVEKFDQALTLKPMAELLQDDPSLQRSLQGYLKRQRPAPDPGVTLSRPQPAPERYKE